MSYSVLAYQSALHPLHSGILLRVSPYLTLPFCKFIGNKQINQTSVYVVSFSEHAPGRLVQSNVAPTAFPIKFHRLYRFAAATFIALVVLLTVL